MKPIDLWEKTFLRPHVVEYLDSRRNSLMITMNDGRETGKKVIEDQDFPDDFKWERKELTEHEKALVYLLDRIEIMSMDFCYDWESGGSADVLNVLVIQLDTEAGEALV